MTKSKNRDWIKQHIKDPYVKQSQKDGYRSRASYKLLEIVEKERMIRPGMTVVDLGSAPGGWSQVASRLVGHEGRLHSLDILPMDPIAGVDFIQGDFTEQNIFDDLLLLIGNRPVDLVISDMAPNLSGVASADAARMEHIAELAVEFAMAHLKPEGALLIKCFHGSGYSQIVEMFKRHFKIVAPRKPKASRDKSSETFLLGRQLKHSG